ncbi:hypothetical protein [Hoeflea sp. TYP-13]|uniref:hypothetical protein n=1 Tax=Hoeflea sp. TYP-13 TaxID=3230023 RepID=UPI0034C5B440
MYRVQKLARLTGLAALIAVSQTQMTVALECKISTDEKEQMLGELCIIAAGIDDLAFAEDECVPRAARMAVSAHLGLIEYHRNCGWTDIANAMENYGTSSLTFLEAMAICVGYPVDMKTLIVKSRPEIRQSAADTGCPPQLRRRLAAELPEMEKLLTFEKDQDNLKDQLSHLGLTVNDKGDLMELD